MRAFSSCGAWASHCSSFSNWGAGAPGAQALVVAAHGLSRCNSQTLDTGSVVVAYVLSGLSQVRSSWTRDQTGVPCITRQILNHWTTREALLHIFFWHLSYSFQFSIAIDLNPVYFWKQFRVSLVFWMKNCKIKTAKIKLLGEFPGGAKSLQMVIAAMKLKDAYSSEGKLRPT